MASTVCVESLVSSTKRLKITIPHISLQRPFHQISIRPHVASQVPSTSRVNGRQGLRCASQLRSSQPESQESELRGVRLPKAVQAVFLAPLKRAPTHGIPVCDLQIRSYSVRNLEAFTDFCMRAAYYLNLPAKGPVPLPRITERWTVPRSHFVHKKSQENFERITVRRLIQIQDGHPDTVALWLAYIQKQRYYGIGMKANVFEHSGLNVLDSMDENRDKLMRRTWSSVKTKDLNRQALKNKALPLDAALEAVYSNTIMEEPFKAHWGAWSGMSGLDNKASGRKRFERARLLRAEIAPGLTTPSPSKSIQSDGADASASAGSENGA